MTAASVLSTRPAPLPRLVRSLKRAGFLAERSVAGVVAVRSGVRISVGEPTKDLGDLPESVLAGATRLLGRTPRWRTPCHLDTAADAAGRHALVDVARGVAWCVPLGVLDDGSGTAHLVHPQRGLLGPEDLRPRPTTPLQDTFRNLIDKPR